LIQAKGYAALEPNARLAPFEFERRDPTPKDVVIDIMYCGVCHSDIHQARNEWGEGIFPMVPGHEIVGRVTQVGKQVRRFSPGDIVGVGCLVDSCRHCHSCQEQQEQYCENGFVATYNSYERDKTTFTYGGYASNIVVDEAFVLTIPSNLDPAAAAPLLCAGITTYSPLKRWGAGPKKLVGVVGLGGLGHMAVKLAKAMGAQVVAFTRSSSKTGDANRLGADRVVVSTNEQEMKAVLNRFDLIIDTVSAPHDINLYTSLLRRDGALVLVGLPDKELSLQAFPLVLGRRSIAGSLIGGLAETQEMLDFCGTHNITADIELTPIQKINECYERTIKGDVHYRFVIDIASLQNDR